MIATKLHIQPETVEDCGSVYAAVRRHLERSLKNLQTGYVDLYYLHRINMEVDYLKNNYGNKHQKDYGNSAYSSTRHECLC